MLFDILILSSQGRKKSFIEKGHFETFNEIFQPINVHSYHENGTITLQWK